MGSWMSPIKHQVLYSTGSYVMTACRGTNNCIHIYSTSVMVQLMWNMQKYPDIFIFANGSYGTSLFLSLSYSAYCVSLCHMMAVSNNGTIWRKHLKCCTFTCAHLPPAQTQRAKLHGNKSEETSVSFCLNRFIKFGTFLQRHWALKHHHCTNITKDKHFLYSSGRKSGASSVF